jgi:hypothetical protein
VNNNKENEGDLKYLYRKLSRNMAAYLDIAYTAKVRP